MEAPTDVLSGPSPASDSLYTEQLYLSLLTHINTSEPRIEALARLALRHLPQAPDTWSAIRKAFVEAAAPQSLTELDGPRNRALWCLVDALLKHAPHVFGPLVSPRLLEYVTQQTPLQLMSSAATAASTMLLFGRATDGAGPAGLGYLDPESEAQRAAAWHWWEALILSWDAFLPVDVFATVRHYVTQRKSTAELDGALAHATAAAARREGLQQAATPDDMQQLRDDFDALRYLCANCTATIAGGIGTVGAGGAYGGYSFEELLSNFLADAAAAGAETSSDPASTAPVEAAAPAPRAVEGGGRQAVKRQRGSGSSSSSNASDSEDDGGEYVPEYVEGAKPRQLPDRGLPAQRRRREARRRVREEDY